MTDTRTVPVSRQAYTIKDFTEAYGISRSKTYELIRDGALMAVKVGNRTLIPAQSANSWFATLEAPAV